MSSGGGAVAATETIVSAGTWRQSGQLSDAATVTAVTLLSQVPGVTTASAGASQTPTTVTRQPAAPVNRDKDDEKGKEKDKGKDD